MDRIRSVSLAAAVIAAALASSAAFGAAQTEEQAPDVRQIPGSVSITAPDIELGRLIDYISQKSGAPIVPDKRFSGVRLTVLGANGSASELLDAVEAATGLELRKLDDWYVLSADRRGAAAVAHEYRRREGRTMAADQAALSLKADAAARRAAMRLGTSIAQPYQAGLTPGQTALLRRQGFLTVADLFPEYYQPMLDTSGQLVDRTAERPASLPQFAGTRVYYYPNLQLLLHVPAQPAQPAQPAEEGSPPQPQLLTWTVDLGGS